MRSFSLKAFALCAVLLCGMFGVLSTAQAQSANASSDAALAFIDKVGSSALNTLKDSALSQAQKQAILQQLFADAVDVDYVAKFVLGRYWRSATPAQQQAYLEAYKPFLIKSYVGRLTNYSGQSYSLISSKPLPTGAVVGMRLMSPDNSTPPVEVYYRLNKTADSFKVVDIIVEGVSLLSTQRSEFSGIVANQGIDFLTSALKKKTMASQ